MPTLLASVLLLVLVGSAIRIYGQPPPARGLWFHTFVDFAVPVGFALVAVGSSVGIRALGLGLATVAAFGKVLIACVLAHMSHRKMERAPREDWIPSWSVDLDGEIARSTPRDRSRNSRPASGAPDRANGAPSTTPPTHPD